jgi:hypothetical protein
VELILRQLKPLTLDVDKFLKKYVLLEFSN